VTIKLGVVSPTLIVNMSNYWIYIRDVTYIPGFCLDTWGLFGLAY